AERRPGLAGAGVHGPDRAQRGVRDGRRRENTARARPSHPPHATHVTHLDRLNRRRRESAVTTTTPSGRVAPGGFAGAIASEWTKLWSVRAAYLCLLAGLAITGVFTYYYASIARINEHPME